MRVSAQTKNATKARILAATGRLLAERGYDATTTRDIARAAQIATGTLFNYFPSKEAVVAGLAAEALQDAWSTVDDDASKAESLEEDLFALVARGLRKLKPLRKHLGSLWEISLSPMAGAVADNPSSLRAGHLEAVEWLVARHGIGQIPPVALQLYWTLFAGALVFWSGDRSPKQEATLALLDHSLAMFAGWLRENDQPPATGRETRGGG